MLCIQKPIRADDFVTAQKKTGDPDWRLCGAFDRLRCGRAGHYARPQRGAVFFLPVSLLRSFIYIGLMTWWGVSLWQRIV